MDKRALMLTAAVAALVSGHAYGATSPCSTTTSTTSPQLCDITTEVTSPINTGTVNPDYSTAIGGLGNVTIDTNGSVVIGINPPAAPAITINSGTAGAPTTFTNITTIDYTGISYTVGALLEEASVPTSADLLGTSETWTGEFLNLGTVNLTGAGTNKIGVLVAGAAYYNSAAATTTTTADDTYASTATYANLGYDATTNQFTPLGPFTGIVPTDGGDPIAINIGLGSTLEVQGTASYGIYLIGPDYPLGTTTAPTGGATLIGDIDVTGTVAVTPTTVGSTSASGNAAIYIAGWEQSNTDPTAPNPALAGTTYSTLPVAMVGSVNIGEGGVVSSEGETAQGIVVLGAIEGGINNSGSIETYGVTTPSTAVGTVNPEASCALCIANNVTQGILNNGVTMNTSGTSNSTAIISEAGTAPAIDISPAVNNNADNYVVPIEIGTVTADLDYPNQFSLLNRGDIEASTDSPNLDTNAITIAGELSAPVKLDGGIFNSGVISAVATTNTQSTTTVVSATAINIGNYATVGTGSADVGGTYSLINTNETKAGGEITATVSGPDTGVATAILIAAPESGVPSSSGVLTSIFNSGTISASATTTTLTETGISAYAIEDETGTLTTILNQGTISATVTELDDNDQLAVAIDTAGNGTTPVTITDQATQSNPASIIGNINFGSLPGTLIIEGDDNSQANYALVDGNLTFNNICTSASTSGPCGTVSDKNDTLTIGAFGSFTGEISEAGKVGSVDITLQPNGTLNLLTTLPTNINSTVPTVVAAGTPLSVGTLSVESGGVLNESLSQDYNDIAFPGVSVINAQTVDIQSPSGNNASALQITFGSFVGSSSSSSTSSSGGSSSGGSSSGGSPASSPGTPSQFVLISAPNSASFNITPEALNALETSIETNQTNAIPYLFTGNICTYNISTASTAQQCTGTEPINSTNAEIVLNLTPKSPSAPVAQGGLGLTGYALKMFKYVNEALINDNTLGAAMVTDITNSQQAQQAYASFAPDVSGATRATAISLTDSASNVVAARQRELLMYANQEGATTLWGQQFGERLSQDDRNDLEGYNDSGFGFVMGMDAGDPADGRYGGALTFFTGGMSEKQPVSSKTSSEYYILTGYTDWRGKGFFFDTQASAGYGLLKGRRYVDLTDSTTGVSVDRVADGNRPTELLAGSVTTGGIFTAGSTVFEPQMDLDGLTMREEAYNESNGGDGMNLHVDPYYADSLRLFAGGTVRQDFNFGDFYFQPELRAGYRYDFIDGMVKLKANFMSVSPADHQSYDPFTIEGPDPGRGNMVLGGGAAITTGAWSIGIDYDLLRAGTGPTEQTGILTLVGRI